MSFYPASQPTTGYGQQSPFYWQNPQNQAQYMSQRGYTGYQQPQYPQYQQPQYPQYQQPQYPQQYPQQQYPWGYPQQQYPWGYPQQQPQQVQLSRFEDISLRMWGHDIQDDGKNNGSVILKTLYNAQGSGNQAFLATPEAQQTLLYHLKADYYDNGQIDGSSLRGTFGQVYQKTTGHDISRQLWSAPLTPFQITQQSVMENAPDMRTAAGLQQIATNTGLSLNQLLNTALWGHDAVDQSARGNWIDGSVLDGALNDPRSIDFGFVHATPQLTQYTQGLVDRDKQQFGAVTGNALNTDFLGAIGQIYGTRFI